MKLFFLLEINNCRNLCVCLYGIDKNGCKLKVAIELLLDHIEIIDNYLFEMNIYILKSKRAIILKSIY